MLSDDIMNSIKVPTLSVNKEAQCSRGKQNQLQKKVNEGDLRLISTKETVIVWRQIGWAVGSELK